MVGGDPSLNPGEGCYGDVEQYIWRLNPSNELYSQMLRESNHTFIEYVLGTKE